MPYTEIVVVFVVLTVVMAFGLAMALLLQTREPHRSPRLRASADHGRALRAQTRRDGSREPLVARPREAGTRQLDPIRRHGFTRSWAEIRSSFDRDPHGALLHAEDLLTEVLRAKGYPVTDPSECARALAREHPDLAAHYRAVEMALASREDHPTAAALKRTLLHYRTLFIELLQPEQLS